MASALVRTLAKAGGRQAGAGEAIPGSGVRRFAYETSRRRYRHCDCPADEVPDLLKAESLDGAVLVVSAMDGVMPQTRKHVDLARAVGIPLFVFFNKCDQNQDAELLELTEMEVRDLLSRSGYDGADMRVVRGSAQAAALGDDFWTGEFGYLAEALDECIPQGRSRKEIPGRARLVAKRSGKVLEVDGGSARNDDGGRIQQWGWERGGNQQWRIEPVGDGYHRLMAVHSGKALDVSGGVGETRNGASVHQWQWVNGDNQKWRIEPIDDGCYRLVAKHSGKVLEIDGGTAKNDNGTVAQQWEWVGSDNQKWRLEPVQDDQR
ncbi:RICIN domain-containing protein [Streptomyces melanogenes]|uniref:RICIN domain-containing protein n=1 Tax=Streptomyces melanogenes TaxID=67326 RepID=UPI00167DDBA6|nr:RICIN domain-containing protein [Streptomyces melanogenes]GGP86886.1 hypothetical protein GCM10010278_76890 [Streptomyces melanogenes]